MDGGNLFAESEGEKLNAPHCCCHRAAVDDDDWKLAPVPVFYGPLNLLALCSERAWKNIEGLLSSDTRNNYFDFRRARGKGNAWKIIREMTIDSSFNSESASLLRLPANNTSLEHPWSASTWKMGANLLE
jgi:hypothetical protein